MKMKTFSRIIFALGALLWLVAISAGFAIQESLTRMDQIGGRARSDLHELMLGHAQTHASKRGIKWSEDKELANAAAMAHYNNVPIGMIWQFRKWENGADLYAWGQIVRASSVKALFWPTKQQSWQAGRTIRQAYPWFMMQYPKEIKASMLKRGLKGPMSMEKLLGDPELRDLFVTYVVDRMWKARAHRKSQKAFIIKQWDKWDNERGAP